MNKLNKNIISNNCTAGFIYHDLNCEFSHPFIWSTITYYNFDKLIDLYEIINFKNFEITNTLLSKAYNTNRWNNTFSILIDNKSICVNFIHHIQDNNKKEIEKKGVELYYYDMKNYVKNLYEKRVQRMLNDKLKEPIFIFCKTIFYTDDEFYKILYKPTKYKKIVLVPYNYSINKNKIPKNTFTILLPKEIHVEPKYAEYLINKYPNLLEIK